MKSNLRVGCQAFFRCFCCRNSKKQYDQTSPRLTAKGKIASLMHRLFGAAPGWRKVGAIMFAPEVAAWCVLFVRSFFILLIIPYRRRLLYTTHFRFQSLQHRTAHAPNLSVYVDIYLIYLSIPISSPVHTFPAMSSHRVPETSGLM